MAKHGDVWRSKCGMMELRCGDYREALADVQCDAVITDPPYSDRTHKGNYAGTTEGDPRADAYKAGRRSADRRAMRKAITYAAWTPADAEMLSGWVREQCSGWCVAITDHVLFPAIDRSMLAVGGYTFAPVPFVEPGKCPRLNGDGPASWCCYLMVSRPRESSFNQWGSLPGSYVFPKGSVEQVRTVTGGKPLALMQAIVRDYSRKGDLVCDPCAGGGTTLLAAAMEGRRAIGAEIDPDTFELAVKRLSNGYTPDLFAGVQP